MIPATVGLEVHMETITIEWHRLVNSDGETCDRCASTEKATVAAFEKLKRCLAEVGLDVILENHEIDQSTFLTDPIESNKIIVDGKSIEYWLGGSTGKSQCCGPCGDAECRTITVDGKTHEAVPETIILLAGLLSAAEKLKQNDSTANSKGGRLVG